MHFLTASPLRCQRLFERSLGLSSSTPHQLNEARAAPFHGTVKSGFAHLGLCPGYCPSLHAHWLHLVLPPTRPGPFLFADALTLPYRISTCPACAHQPLACLQDDIPIPQSYLIPAATTGHCLIPFLFQLPLEAQPTHYTQRYSGYVK